MDEQKGRIMKHYKPPSSSPLRLLHLQLLKKRCQTLPIESLKCLKILLIEETVHHLESIKPYKNGINYLSTGAGFLPSTVVFSGYLFYLFLCVVRTAPFSPLQWRCGICSESSRVTQTPIHPKTKRRSSHQVSSSSHFSGSS